jgi:hypothetical protein
MTVGPRRGLVLVLTVVLALGLTGLAAADQAEPPVVGAPAGAAPVNPDAEAELVPLGMSIADVPHPVLGADGRNHLAYEVTIVNQTQAEVTIESVQARAGRRAVGPRLQGESLDGMLRVNGGGGPAIPGGGSALLFMDVDYARDMPRPRRLTHAVTMTLSQPSAEDQVFRFVGVPTPVARARALEIGKPMRGARWVAGNGCCQPINAHRGATLSIDGTVRTPERFAIDWVRLRPDGRLFEGPIDQLSSYAFYGAPILSVAKGRVVAVQDGLPDQVPGSLPSGATIQTAGGNHVVVKLAPRRFAFYAHLQPGSLRVQKGGRVRQGQVLGLLGNSGNTDAPHLHFHIMDGPSPLQSNGLPFVHRRFTGQGVVTDEALLLSGAVTPVDRGVLTGRTRARMPMNLQVVDFRRWGAPSL